ncbi:uncharacterized protein LOC120328380 [Styela clava]
MAKLLILWITAQCIGMCYSHSWLACTDYAEKNARYYDHKLCRGYARSAIRFAPRGGEFGLDKDFNHSPVEDTPCRTKRNDSTEYNKEHPMAVYYPGQQVVLAHPMNYHGSDWCSTIYVPDKGSFIYRGEKNDEADLTFSEFRKNLVADLGAKDPPVMGSTKHHVYPKPGYQNAPAFCENMRKSLGTYSFNVPKNLEPGQYTFMWLWAFNSFKEIYSTCFEVKIVKTLKQRNVQLAKNGFENFYEPCGGKTSNFSIRGNTNPGCRGYKRIKSQKKPKISMQKRKPATHSITAAVRPVITLPQQIPLEVQTEEIRGKVVLPKPRPGITRRYITFSWNCPAVANFWNARVVSTKNHGGQSGQQSSRIVYSLIQDVMNINEAEIFYHVKFVPFCNTRKYKLKAELVREE